MFSKIRQITKNSKLSVINNLYNLYFQLLRPEIKCKLYQAINLTLTTLSIQ